MPTLKDLVTADLIRSERLQERGADFPDEVFQKLLEDSGVRSRNVCIRMHPCEKAQIDALLSFLDLSLQDFVHEAVRDAVSGALDVFEKRGYIPAFRDVWKEKCAAEGFELRPSVEDSTNLVFIPVSGQPGDSVKGE